MDTSPDVESAFLIYNFEQNAIKNDGKSNVIKQLNRKINKYGHAILNSNYKHVNNFSYTTDTFHNFYKITEYYLLKYFNSIIVDSTLFFKCIHVIKNGSSGPVQNVEMGLRIHFNMNKNTQEGKKLMDNLENDEALTEYSFDCAILNYFIENLKKVNNSNNKTDKINEKKKRKGEKKENVNNDADIENITNSGIPNPETYIKTERRNNSPKKNCIQNYNFRKSFLYELCEMYSSLNNKKNRKIYITKIFRKIVSRKQIRQFICENDMTKKKNYLKFFLNLSLGIFIYIYIYRYIKKNYKNVEFFIFLNNPQNIKDIYVNNISYIEKEEIYSFTKYIKFLNIQMFRYVYISFFVNIYKYVNLIYNTTLLALYNYFKYINEIMKNKEESLERQKEEVDKNYHVNLNSRNVTNNTSEKGSKRNNGKNTNEENITHEINMFTQNIQTSLNGLVKDGHIDSNKTDELQKCEKINNKIDENSPNDLSNKKGEEEIKPTCSERQDYNPNLSNSGRIHTNKMVFSCYIYIYIFSIYIRDTRKMMKSNIIKIQNNIKKMIGLFVQIYDINKIECNRRNSPFKDCNKGKTTDSSNNLANEGGNSSHIVGSAHALYFNFIQLSKCYKCCIKNNYQIIKSIHMFHLLLKHFYKYFPILNMKKDKCIIYNYYNKKYIYYTKEIKINGVTESVNFTEEKNRKKKEEMAIFDIFKNVNDYELDFFYFNERKNDEREIIIDLLQSKEVESFDNLFQPCENTFSSSQQNTDMCTVGYDKNENENENDNECIDKLHNNPEEHSKNIFLNCVNNSMNMLLIRANEEFAYNSDEGLQEVHNLVPQKGGNCNRCSTDSSCINENSPSLRYCSILQHLKTNKNVYNKIAGLINRFCNNKSESVIKKCISDLNIYNKNVLDIYDDSIFDVYNRIEKQATFENEESIKNKKLLQVKVFLDYEKLYTKKTVETQTPISFFKNEKAIQIPKDQEVCTTSEQYIQAKKIVNPIFYLNDIYE
ncbi:hypothetical protein, conserved [Plasmodium gonderi]|uniref:Uncharacterized protein n=1 Tax=Plasmodium gonderi TaxID=77519 RepID=A0A1Y1JSM6_PLAGO|nr:hypothetical protein, conserved [Plasmodium gonderi]GAW83423.1 hypothetical protein, conserved [Plasmodium gonderi]